MRNIHDRRLREPSHDGSATNESWRPNFNNRVDSASSFNQVPNSSRTYFKDNENNVVLTSVYGNNNSFLRNQNRSPMKGGRASYTTPDTSFENSYERDPHLEDDGAVIQFVAPELSNDIMFEQKTRHIPLDAASWDAILHHPEKDDEKKETDTTMITSTTQQIMSNSHMQSDSRTTVSSGTRRVPGGRIARLATIFSSRATVSSVDGNDNLLSPKADRSGTHVRSNNSSNPAGVGSMSHGSNDKGHTNKTSRHSPVSTITPIPLSPVESSGSSAYVGWPGTQDRRGQTVVHQSSYDDSSVGTHVSPVPTNRGGTVLRSVNCLRKHQQDRDAEDFLSEQLMNPKKATRKYEQKETPYDDYCSTDESLSYTQPKAARNSRNDTRRQHVPATTTTTPKESKRSISAVQQSESQTRLLSSVEKEAEEMSNSRSNRRESKLNPAEYHLAGAISDANNRESLQRKSFSALRYSKGSTDNSHQDVLPNANIPYSWSKKNVDHSSAIRNTASDFALERKTNDSEFTPVNLSTASDLSNDSFATANMNDDKFERFDINLSPIARQSMHSNQGNNANSRSSPKQSSRFKALSQSADTTALLMFGNASQIRSPTEDAIAENNRMISPHRSFQMAEGYTGLLDKTKDVPALMDNMDSDSMSSSKATSVYSSTGQQNFTRKPLQQPTIFETQAVDEKPIIRGILRTANRSVVSDLDNESDVFDGLSFTKESDVFDNVSSVASPRKHKPGRVRYHPDRITEEEDDEDYNDGPNGNNGKADVFQIVVLPGGITTIQTTDRDYSIRRTASDYDDQLTASEVSSNGYTRIPGFDEMLSSGIHQDSSLHGIHGNFGRKLRPHNVSNASRSLVLEDITCASDADEKEDDQSCGTEYDDEPLDLRQYSVRALDMQKLVNKYRELSDHFDPRMSLDQFENEEDDHKAFALFEMRSRIMAKDIERGLERRGGTKIVDDIVTTAYFRAAHRIRDAIIVCKAWRDGATIADVIKTSVLGRKNERTQYIRRRVRETNHRNAHAQYFSDTASFTSGFSAVSSTGSFYWEAVKWLDDTDILQYRCPTLGSRHLRGFEMFTIGDCQSMLLKLTNERCMELRQDLNEATTRQIEAEDMLKEEGDNFQGEMTESEFAYLTSMEEVKSISKQLVQAEQSFALVHDRIKKLIDRYEAILMKIENNSSVVTYESSCYSSTYWEELEQREREMWARRAQRAEIRAEIAAREVFLAKQETREVERVKQHELDLLKQKLQEVQSEPSSHAPFRENSAAIAKSLAMRRHDVVGPVNNTSRTVLESKQRINNEKVQDVKQRFRERMVAKKQESDILSHANLSPPSSARGRARELFLGADEEMLQQMDFYERSLQAVNRTRL